MGKAQQAGNDKAKRKREGRLVIVAELYKKGYSCRQISEEVMKRLDIASYSTSVVHRDIQVLLKEWRSGRLEDMDDAIQLELERIDDTVRELWGQWERSKEAQIEVYKSKRGRPSGGGTNGSGGGLQTVEATETEKTKAGLGDVSYIAEIRKQLMERRKLLGLYAPEKKDISGGVSFASFLIESGQIDLDAPTDDDNDE